MSILIKNVLHQNRRVDVLIKDGRFEKIAPDTEAPADKLIDGSGKAIVPAFYNTHCHAAMSILRGYGDDKPLFAWLREDIWPVESRLTPRRLCCQPSGHIGNDQIGHRLFRRHVFLR